MDIGMVGRKENLMMLRISTFSIKKRTKVTYAKQWSFVTLKRFKSKK